MGGIGFLQQLNVPLLALKGADGMPSMLAVQISRVSAADAPTELAARNTQLIQQSGRLFFLVRSFFITGCLFFSSGFFLLLLDFGTWKRGT